MSPEQSAYHPADHANGAATAAVLASTAAAATTGGISFVGFFATPKLTCTAEADSVRSA